MGQVIEPLECAALLGTCISGEELKISTLAPLPACSFCFLCAWNVLIQFLLLPPAAAFPAVMDFPLGIISQNTLSSPQQQRNNPPHKHLIWWCWDGTLGSVPTQRAMLCQEAKSLTLFHFMSGDMATLSCPVWLLTCHPMPQPTKWLTLQAYVQPKRLYKTQFLPINKKYLEMQAN